MHRLRHLFSKRVQERAILFSDQCHMFPLDEFGDERLQSSVVTLTVMVNSRERSISQGIFLNSHSDA